MRGFALGVLGMTPQTFYSLTLAEYNDAAWGYFNIRERDMWARTLRITGMWGDKLRINKLFGPSVKRIEGKQEYEEFKKQFRGA